jgi:hypothetical protein
MSSPFNFGSLEQEFAFYAEINELTEMFESIRKRSKKKKNNMNELLAILTGAGFTLLVKGEIAKFISQVFSGTGEAISESLVNEIKCFNAGRTAKAIAYAYQKLKDAGIEPQQIELKTLIPLLEGISIESDETLQQKWVNLLTSAASGNTIHPSYIKILSELGSIDVKILDGLYKRVKDSNPEQMLHRYITTAEIDEISSDTNDDAIGEALDNLFRLKLIAVIPDEGEENEGENVADLREFKNIQIGFTSVGIRFVRACTDQR